MIRRWFIFCTVLIAVASTDAMAQVGAEPTAPTPATIASPANAADAVNNPKDADPIRGLQLPDLARRENLSSAMQIIVLLTVLSLAPAILIMMTSFTRIIIVM